MKTIIQSSQNKIIKNVLSLKEKKYRDECNCFIVEGLKFVDEIPNDWNIHSFIVSEQFANSKALNKYLEKAKIYVVSDNLFTKLSDTKTPQGILAICEQKKYTLSLDRHNHFIVFAEKISDPGNLGTLIRTADAAGCDAVIISENSTDVYSNKTIRATAGSIFHIPIIKGASVENTVATLKEHNVKLIAAHLKGKIAPYEVNMNTSIAFLIGNESNGLSEQCSGNADILVKLPMIGKAESLNASVACGILLYEVVRQRL